MTSTRRTRSTPYLAILIEKRAGGGAQVHAGLAKHGIGRTMCSDRQLFEFWVPVRQPDFALYRTDGWRHRYAEAFLELNHGCKDCLDVLYAVGREAGYAKPKSLSV
jgi:hypothetical protein